MRRRSAATSAASGGSPYSGDHAEHGDRRVADRTVAFAPRTASRCEASTPGGPPQQARPVERRPRSPRCRRTIAAGPPSATSASWSSRSGTGSGMGSPSSTADTRAHQVRDQARPSSRSTPRARSPARPPAQCACSSSSSSRAADVGGDMLHGHRVVEVAPGRHHGQQQVMADGGRRSSPRPRRSARPGGRTSRATTSPETLWSPGQPLPMSCSSAGEQQQVGPRHVAGQRRGVRGALHQVPVHGEPVQRVALRPVAYPLPVRDQRGQQALLVQRLPDGDRRSAPRRAG